MGKYRFTWDAFDSTTIETVATSLGYQQRNDQMGRTAKGWLSEAVKRPNEYFVQEAKTALENSWLQTYPGTKQIVDNLIDAGIGPIGLPQKPEQQDYVNYIRKCKNAKTLRKHLLYALLKFGDSDLKSDEREDPSLLTLDFVPRFAILNPRDQEPDSRKPHDYQQEAWEELSQWSRSQKNCRGILSMPTGSGKTYTSLHWVIKNVVNRGDRLLWLAHRHELLEQAARQCYALARLASDQEKLRIRLVSGAHCSPTQIDPADQIVIASVPSLWRRKDVAQSILSDPRTFLVIDEAHHSPAKSYRELIEFFVSQPHHRILGLTATPTYRSDGGKAVLSDLFADQIIYEISIKDLIERQLLARPYPIRVKTNEVADRHTTLKDEQYFARFNELSEDLLDEIAHIENRNTAIVGQYLSNREKYGKTLIFAINVAHAALLAQRFQAHGVKADYVASYRMGGDQAASDGERTQISNASIIQRFKDVDPDDSLDVLINVQILTEGVDIPGIQTVFLTRPTNSEILLRQMIGRALRGEKAGGTEKAYIVSFEDHWEKFRDWQDPLHLVPDIVPPITPPTPKVVPEDRESPIPWDLVQAAANQVASQGSAFAADAFEALPHGWYILLREDEQNTVRFVIPVYEHQVDCWEALLDCLQGTSPEDLAYEPLFEELDAEYFGDCDAPQPSRLDVRAMIEHFANGGDRPEYNVLENREYCNPYVIANRIVKEDLGENARGKLIEERYTSLAQAIYPSLRAFSSAIEDARFEIRYPAEATRQHKAVPLFHRRTDIPLQLTPCHDLAELSEEVFKQVPKLLSAEAPLVRPTIEWTKRLVKGWYGTASWETDSLRGSGRIRINTLLNSPDVDSNVIQYLVWHEYLHLYLQAGHTPEFRNYERRWSGYQECDRFLDNLNEKFEVQYW